MSNEKIWSLLNTLKIYRAKASETDYIMPTWLPFIGLILVLIAMFIIILGALLETFILLGAGLALAIFGGLAGFAVSIYVLYKWIDRMNNHFRRTMMFYSTLADIAEELKIPEASRIRNQVNELKIVFEERSPVLWVILSIFVPFIEFYVYHFLNKDFVKHCIRERLILSSFADGLKAIAPEYTIDIDRLYMVPNRSTLLYIVLTIITLGLFGLYWIYTLTVDPNRHFESHQIIEEKIIAAVEAAARKTITASTSGEGEQAQ
ncbi:DUF4234 domain-containing protein [Desulfurococcaceae archaeon MEX13E-LK6-19]|nr:DUF4234 domain-containing protein [Desulfurococcaceae archaeon MEX13E-LK6-19]